MVPAWMVAELNRKEAERREAEERARRELEIPAPEEPFEVTLDRVTPRPVTLPEGMSIL